MNVYDLGDLAHVTVAFTTSAGVATDPTIVNFKYRLADDTTWTTLVYGTDIALIKDSVGNYHVDINCDAVGVARYRWWSTGTGQAAVEDSFLVYDSSSLVVSLIEAKQHLRIDSTDTSHDAHIPSLILAAQVVCENFLERYLLTGTRYKYLDSFPDELLLPAPLTSITSIKYYDTANAQQTLAATYYALDVENANKPCQRVRLAYGYTWPSIYDRPDAIEVKYICGWTSSASVPEPIRQAVLLACEHLYEGPQEGSYAGSATRILEAAETLMYPYRWMSV